MEAEPSVLDDYVLSLVAGARAAHLPAADRGRRLRGADPALPDRVRRPPVRAERGVAVPARARAADAARAPARAGRDLRRRRLDDQPAGAVARARARRDPARGVAGRDRAGRAQRRRDVLVRGRHHQGDGRGRGRSPASASCPGSASVHYDGEPDRRPAYLEPRWRRARCRPATGSTTASACCSAAPASPRSSPPAPACAPTASTPSRAPRASTSSSPACWRGASTLPPGAVPHDIGELRLLRAARRRMATD